MKTNTAVAHVPVFTHEGAVAQRVDAYRELRRTLLTCFLFEDTFYESGDSIASRIAELVPKVAPEKVAALAVEARDKMLLRHAPLWLVRQLAATKGNGKFVEQALWDVIQRADELSEFVALYWRDKKQPLSAAVKRGLATAFTKFSAYDLAKYNRDAKVKLRDVLFLCHAKPKDAAQAEVWKRLVNKTLEPPDTWEVALSANKEPAKEIWERLLCEGKLGGLAVLRNLRNMQKVSVDEELIRKRLAVGIKRALPFRFVAAARYAPNLEDAIEGVMLEAVGKLDELPGRTGLLIDVSGSMGSKLSSKSEMTRLDAASALAILLREKCPYVRVATFSDQFIEIPNRRGFALRDAIEQSQPHSSTKLRMACDRAAIAWQGLDHFIVLTDEQSQDGLGPAFCQRSYCINVAPYKHGLSYGNGWQHIDGFSERVIDFIAASEQEESVSKQ